MLWRCWWSRLLCFCAAALPSIILTAMFSPYQRGIYCDDKSISYPYRRDTISHAGIAAVTITCSIFIVSPKHFISFHLISSQLRLAVRRCFPRSNTKPHWASLRRSPQARPTWCTPSGSTPTPSSTSTCRLSTRWWAPSCSEEPSASRWPTWPSSPSAALVPISCPCALPSSATDTWCRSTAPATL